MVNQILIFRKNPKECSAEADLLYNLVYAKQEFVQNYK